MRQQAGVALATVTNLKDPQGEGRIKVKYTSFMDGGPESARAPIATPMAGKKRGVYFMPEVGDEVLVAFDRGYFDHPYVIGFLWNGIDRPPENDPHLRLIHSVNGHEIAIYDPPGEGDKGYILLQDANGNKVELKQGGITIHSVGPITIEAPAVAINGQAVTIKAPTIDINAAGILTLNNRPVSPIGGPI